MGTSWINPDNPLSAGFRAEVTRVIGDFCDLRTAELATIGGELAVVAARAREFTAGGKRLRPAFCLWGYVAATSHTDDDLDGVVRFAAALDLLHVSALMHDDVMDNSDTRRGLPAAHRQFEQLHRAAGWVGEPDTFGRAGAILLGDLLTMWSMQMTREALALPPLRGRDVTTALGLLETMRTEVTCGQFLDVVAQSHDPLTVGIEQAFDEANRVVEYKSARYSVQRPVQIGAAMGSASDDVLAALADYGSWLGRAFQFRDDILGVFGAAETTGKPEGGDLVEGKRTLLLATALDIATGSERSELAALVGSDLDADGLTRARELMSGARDQLEGLITDYLDRSLAALNHAEISDVGRTALTALANAAVYRNV